MSVDIGPVHVRGALRARWARVIWDGGTLYIVNRHGTGLQRQTAQTTEPVAPDTASGFWRAKTDEGKSISWSKRGCGG